MIIDRSTGLTQVLVALLKDDQKQGIQSFGNSTSIIAYLKAHPDQSFYLEPSLAGRMLTDPLSGSIGLARGDIFIGQLRFDSQQNRVVCGEI